MQQSLEGRQKQDLRKRNANQKRNREKSFFDDL